MSTTETTKQRFPLAMGQVTAKMMVQRLQGFCERIKIAGSIRRRQPDIGDVELLIIPKTEARDSGDLFGTKKEYSLLDPALDSLVAEGVMEYRKTALETIVNGKKIKLFRHLLDRIPVDVFVATEENWWNYLVCRTGPSKSNIAIASRAKKLGLKWEPYSSGFVVPETGERIVCRSEREVFDTVDLPYRDPDGSNKGDQ